MRGEHRDRHLLGRRVAVFLAELDEAERIGAQASIDTTVSGQRYWSQLSRNEKIASTDSAGQALRHDDLQQDAQFAGAVDARRLDIV